MSQEQLALEAGIDRSYVGQVERFEKNVTVVTLQKIAHSLGLTINEFLDLNQTKNVIIVGAGRLGQALLNYNQLFNNNQYGE